MPLPPKYNKKGSYFTGSRFPSKRTEKRLQMPKIPLRPLRFQVRSLIRKDLIQKDPYWLVIHRRGISRPDVGMSPLELRATSHELIRGTLPERIIYKALVKEYDFIPGLDFDFQSSLQGGRVDTGGIVADFLFPYLMIVLNPLGPTHYGLGETHFDSMQMLKDDEQVMALEEMGYKVFMVSEAIIYNQEAFDRWMRAIFLGQGQVAPVLQDGQVSNNGLTSNNIKSSLVELQTFMLNGAY